MKQILLSFLLLLSAGVTIAQKLDGAFILTGGQHGNRVLTEADVQKEKIVKIFKNGYWIGAFFGNPQQPFNGTCGGTYKTEKGNYIEKVDYYSWDSTAVGDTYIFKYTLNHDRYVQDGKMDSEKYPNYTLREEFAKLKSDKPLKDAFMEGAWVLKDATWKDETGKEGSIKKYDQIKIYSYPRFAYAQFNRATKQFVGAGGGTYEYDGQKLIEHIEYTTYETTIGSDYEIKLQKLPNGEIQQISQDGSFKETWNRANHN